MAEDNLSVMSVGFMLQVGIVRRIVKRLLNNQTIKQSNKTTNATSKAEKLQSTNTR